MGVTRRTMVSAIDDSIADRNAQRSRPRSVSYYNTNMTKPEMRSLKLNRFSFKHSAPRPLSTERERETNARTLAHTQKCNQSNLTT